LNWLARFPIYLIGDETLQGANIDWLIHQTAIAGCLAAMVANAPADTGEGVIHLDNAQGILPATLADEGNVALGTLTGWACIPARSYATLLNGISIWYSLRIKLVGCATERQTLVEAVRYNYRTDLDAITTGYTASRINVTGSVLQPYGKIACPSG
jgi:hypothetical protein